MKFISLLLTLISIVLMMVLRDDLSAMVMFGVLALYNYMTVLWIDITDKIEEN